MMNKKARARRYRGATLPSSSQLMHMGMLAAALAFALCLVAGSLNLPGLSGSAHAATWPTGAARLSVSLGFHSNYVAGGNTYRHSGVDIAADAGTRILAPVSGTVQFVGQVPSGDSMIDGGGEGETATAISIKMGDGRSLTLMPVDSAQVEKGDSVTEGQAVASLAASGDRSSSAAHLHMGLKRDGVYYDPMELFGGASGSGASDVLQESAAGNDCDAVTATAEAEPVTVDVSVSPQPSIISNQELGKISSGNVEWSPSHQTEGAGALGWLESVATGVLDALGRQASSLWEGLRSLAVDTGVPMAILAVIAAVVAVAIATFAVVMGMKLGRYAIGVLRTNWGDDTLRKLLPASGIAFRTRSHLARRR